MKKLLFIPLLFLFVSLSANDTLRTVIKYDYTDIDSVPVSKSVYKYRFGDIYKVYSYRWINDGWVTASETKYVYDTDSHTNYEGLLTKRTDFYIDSVSPFPSLLELYSSSLDQFSFYGGGHNATLNESGTGYTGEVLKLLGTYEGRRVKFDSTEYANQFTLYNESAKTMMPTFPYKECIYAYSWSWEKGLLYDFWLTNDGCEVIRNDYERNSKRLPEKKYTKIIKYEPDSCPACCYKIQEYSLTQYRFSDYDTLSVVKYDLIPDEMVELWKDTYSYTDTSRIVTRTINGITKYKTFYYYGSTIISGIYILNADLKVYPNPVTDKLNIPYSKYEIYDLEGRLIKSGNNDFVFMTGEKTGMYILKLVDFNKSVKFFKE